MSQLAIIIINFYGHRDTEKCVESVFANLKSKIFLVDNSNSQAERTILTNLFESNSDIQLIFPKENLGFAAGVNLALKNAVKKKYKRFLLLNNDAVLLKGSDKILDDAFEMHHCSLLMPKIKEKTITYSISWYHKYFAFQSRGKKKATSIGWFPYFSGCVLGFDHQVINKIGFMDESFFMYGEDVEYSYRALSKGIPLVELKEEMVFHEGSKSTEMNSFFYEYHVLRGHYILSFKMFNNSLLCLVSCCIKSISMFFRAIIRSFRYRNFISIKAYLLAPFVVKVRPVLKE